MPLPQGIAQFNRRVTNRLTGKFAGKMPGFAIVVHTGRKSRKTYHTPVNAFRTGNDIIIALTYGSETDWVRNVLAAGACEITMQGQQISLTHPRLLDDRSRHWAPLPVRLILGLIGATQYMRLSRASASSTSGASGPQSESDVKPVQLNPA